jgi:N-hydroxyarylamine O-acetyltransferase
MDVQKYLERINYNGALTTNLPTLAALQLAHLYAVPFENLNISLGRPLNLAPDALFDKIVTRRRGGFCYELNGLFARLLRELGFDVTLLNAQVARDVGGFGPDFDHMTLMVRIDGACWLVDVGFGESCRQPLPLDEGAAWPDPDYNITRDGEYSVLRERDSQGQWHAGYRFTLQSHNFAEYEPMCIFHQTSPDSSFTRRRVCTLARPNGRITLSDMRLITTAGTEKTERILASDAEYAAILRDEFGIIL